MKTYRRIKAVKPTLDMLVFLANQREPVTSLEISAGLGIKYGTTMCYLVSLEDDGFARRTGDQWELGMGAALLWARMKAKKEDERQNIDRDLRLLQTGGV